MKYDLKRTKTKIIEFNEYGDTYSSVFSVNVIF